MREFADLKIGHFNEETLLLGVETVRYERTSGP